MSQMNIELANFIANQLKQQRTLHIGEEVYLDEPFDTDLNGVWKIGLINGEEKDLTITAEEAEDTIVLLVNEFGNENEEEACYIYQKAPFTHFGRQLYWEHNRETDYPLYCPEEEENCYFIETDEY